MVGVTPSTLLPAPRLRARSVVLRWLLVSLVLTGIIAMHVLSQHDDAGGHHGSMIQDNAAAVSNLAPPHDGHDEADTAAPVSIAVAVAAPMLTPAAPDNNGADMAACILFLVIGAGALLLALLTAVRRRFESFTARGVSGLVAAAPRGPPLIGPPRISLCVLRV